MKFRTTILQEGKTATGIQVPPAIVEGLGAGKRPPVRVLINGYTYRSTIATMNGVFMLGISAEVRAGAGVAGGDEIDVDMELDTEPREVTVPPDMVAALDADPEARRFFDSLSYSNRRRLVGAVETIKSADTRARRIATTVAKLHDGQV
ncbi:MAG: hypothetical protein QOK05_1061 [Chloroflexota bacterium]|jgi:hypothetical protein|nr:hypothetical protein [Chloroflexota bacterium]